MAKADHRRFSHFTHESRWITQAKVVLGSALAGLINKNQ